MTTRSRTAVSAAFVLVLLACAHRAAAQSPRTLTLAEAERLALANHPAVLAAGYAANAAMEGVRETRAPYFPIALGSVTGAGALNGSRIAAGALNNPVIYDRLAAGVAVAQLVTDFGRTSSLVESAALNARSLGERTAEQREAVVATVDLAYFNVLRAQAVERVARATVDNRGLVADQVGALAQGNLKSGLDVSFAQVNLATARLQLSQAQNETRRSYAQLAEAIGEASQTPFVVSEEPMPDAPPESSEPLITAALDKRPDVAAAKLAAEAAASLADAEGDLARPVVSAVGAAGVAPVHQAAMADRYAAAAINLSVPIFNGGAFAARHTEATLRAKAAAERLRAVRNDVARDVQVAWLNARTAFERVGLTRQLLEQSSQALDLATSRYGLGLSSIVELSQAQLNQTQAEMARAAATYDYQAAIAALNAAAGARP